MTINRKNLERMLTRRLLQRYENAEVEVPAPLRSLPNQIVYTALEDDELDVGTDALSMHAAQFSNVGAPPAAALPPSAGPAALMEELEEL